MYAGQNLADVFNALNVAPDFDYTKPESDTRLLFVHRKLADGDLYFVDNRNDRDETVDASFRVTGKAPELWHAETGKFGAGVLSDRGRPHDRAAAPGALGHGLRRLPQPTTMTSRTLPKMVETRTRDGGRPVERSLPAGARSAVPP